MNRPKQPRVVIYYPGFRHRAGGAFQHAVAAAAEFENRGWQVSVLTLDDLPVFVRYLPTLVGKLINMLRAPMGFAYRGRLSAFLFRTFRKVPADLIIFEEIYISWNSTTPSITLLHATWSDNLQGIPVKDANLAKLIAKEEELLENIDHAVVSVSDEYKDFLTSDVFSSALKKHIDVVPLSLEFTDAETGAPRQNEIVFTGRLEPRKNPFLLISAFEAFHRRNDQFSMVIIGDGPLLKDLQALAQEKALPIRFLGRLSHDDVFKQLLQSRIYIHTSTKESFSFSLLEAKLCGLATCAYGGLQVPREFIDHPASDFSVDEWVRAMEMAVKQGPVHHVRASDYSPKIMIDRTLDLAGISDLRTEE